MDPKSRVAQPNPASAPVHILVVDDHPSSAATLARVLAQMGPGVEVASAEGGEQALNLMQNTSVDVLITDLVMPGMTGLELIEKMQVLPDRRPAYTILMTAYDVPGLKEIARRLMVSEVVSKPVQPQIICGIVSRAIEICGWGPIHRPSSSPADGDPPGSKEPLR
jgi:two-component system sensor histidine kinase/response regulator